VIAVEYELKIENVFTSHICRMFLVLGNENKKVFSKHIPFPSSYKFCFFKKGLDDTYP